MQLKKVVVAVVVLLGTSFSGSSFAQSTAKIEGTKKFGPNGGDLNLVYEYARDQAPAEVEVVTVKENEEPQWIPGRVSITPPFKERGLDGSTKWVGRVTYNITDEEKEDRSFGRSALSNIRDGKNKVYVRLTSNSGDVTLLLAGAVEKDSQTYLINVNEILALAGAPPSRRNRHENAASGKGFTGAGQETGERVARRGVSGYSANSNLSQQ